MTDRTNEFESHPHGDPHDVGGVRPEDVPEGPVVDTADADGQGGYGPPVGRVDRDQSHASTCRGPVARMGCVPHPLRWLSR